MSKSTVAGLLLVAVWVLFFAIQENSVRVLILVGGGLVFGLLSDGYIEGVENTGVQNVTN